jgi:hypothetical protein
MGIADSDGWLDGASTDALAAPLDDSASDGPQVDVGSDGPQVDGPQVDAGVACSVDGVAGQCVDVAECATQMGYTSTPGYCPGPANIECCTLVPNVADNPPVPDGWKLMAQADVTSDMTAWAVAILDDPTTYPMFSTTMRVFGSLTVLARVEWHPPDFQNSTVHRGVTLYQPV